MIKLVKLNGKRALNFSWSKAVAETLILHSVILLFVLIGLSGYALLSFDGLLRDLRYPPLKAVICVISVSLLGYITVFPLILGIKAWYYDLSLKGKGEDISLCFIAFSSVRTFFTTVYLGISLLLKKIFILAGFSLIPLILTLVSLTFCNDAQTVREIFLSGSSFIIGIILLFLSLVLSYVFSLRYFPVSCCFIENGLRNVRGAFKTSSMVTKGCKGSLFLFTLSVMHLSVLSCLPLFSLYSYPVLKSCKAIYSRFLIEDYYAVEN